MNNKSKSISMFLLGVAMSTGSLLASADHEDFKPLPSTALSLPQSDLQTVVKDIYLDAKRKIILKEAMMKSILNEKIPDNMSRLTFKKLAQEGIDSIDAYGLTWNRYNETSQEFCANQPSSKSILSNTLNGLMRKSIEVKSHDCIVEYEYKASRLDEKDSYSFKVRTILDPYNRLAKQVDDLKRRLEIIEARQNIDLDIDDRLKTLHAIPIDFSKHILPVRAINIYSEAREKLNFAKKSLDTLRDKKDLSPRKSAQYVAFAWNVYQLRDLIENGLSSFMAKLGEKTDNEHEQVAKLKAMLDEQSRNLNLQFDNNISEFLKWYHGQHINQDKQATFERALDD